MHNARKAVFSFLLPVLLITGCGSERSRLSGEISRALTHGFLEIWYPRAVDGECGGFLSGFDADWNPVGAQAKAVVTQARHVWTCSQASRFFPGHKAYAEAAARGFVFLKEKQWDGEHGGFYQSLDRNGRLDPGSDMRDEKRAYGNAFGMFACAAYFRATGDSSALRLAQDTFRWLDSHAHDPVHLGYFQNLRRDGTPVPMGDPTAAGFDGATAGFKDQNSSIHLLEAFTALYAIWPDPVLGARLQEMFLLIRDTMVSPQGSLRLFFFPDWKPVSYRDSSAATRESHFVLDHVSFGHDVETAFLLLEASAALRLEQDAKTLTVAKRMVDQALRNGWDQRKGGFFYMGYQFPGSDTVTVIDDSKQWWVQAEALHTLLQMAILFPQENRYMERFRDLWKYMKSYLFDPIRGGWFQGGIDNHPEFRNSGKGNEWKATYHETRSLLHCMKMLDGQRWPLPL
jgi:mannobiose 2-epimerase